MSEVLYLILVLTFDCLTEYIQLDKKFILLLKT
jgi:hypothetical protein